MTSSPTSRRVLLLLLAVVALIAAACGGDDGSETADTTTTAATETTTTTQPDSPGRLIEFHDFSPGDCFDERIVVGQGITEIDIEGRVATDTTLAEQTDTTTQSEERFLVACDLPHDNEVFLVIEMEDVAGAPYPGEEVVQEFADVSCFTAFEDYVGQQYELSQLEIAYFMPTEESWPLPDREVVCFVFNRSGPKLEGSVNGLGL